MDESRVKGNQVALLQNEKYSHRKTHSAGHQNTGGCLPKFRAPPEKMPSRSREKNYQKRRHFEVQGVWGLYLLKTLLQAACIRRGFLKALVTLLHPLSPQWLPYLQRTILKQANRHPV
jgi:hypothetical protein